MMLPTTTYPLPSYLFGAPAGVAQPQQSAPVAMGPRFGKTDFHFDDYGMDYRPVKPQLWLPYFAGGASSPKYKPHSLVILA